MHRTDEELADLIARARPSRHLTPGPGFTARTIAGAAAWRDRRRRTHRALAVGASLAAAGVLVALWAAGPARPLAVAVAPLSAEPAPAAPNPPAGGPRGDAPSMSADWGWIEAAMTQPPSAEQQRRLDEAERIAIRLRAELGIAALDLRRELERPRPDPDRVERLIVEIGRLETELRRTRILAWVRADDTARADREGDAEEPGPRDPPRDRTRGERSQPDRHDPEPVDPSCDEVSCLVEPDRPCCERFQRPPPPPDAPGLAPRPTRSDIQVGMSAVAGALRACGREHGHVGVVSARTAILPSGRVGEVVVNGGSDAVRACVAREVGRARFPVTEHGVTVNYPFRL